MKNTIFNVSRFGFSVKGSQANYRNFGHLSYDPFLYSKPPLNPEGLKQTVEKIHSWAKSHGARYYSFLAFPHSGAIAEKQQTFLGLSYQKHNLIRHIASEKLKISDLLKGQGDGSSFLNGGLRHTHAARGYFIWDWKSKIFINRNNRVLYIPSLLVNHFGQALDDKTTYRKAESLIQKECVELLRNLDIQSKGIFIGLGLQQQFFVVQKEKYHKRLDLNQTGRTLFGLMAPHHQQLSDHYYARLQPTIEKILQEAENQLIEIGIPIKTRHKQVAPNQYEFCSIFEEASRAIDNNIIKMSVVQQACDRYGYVPLWHQKPFRKINGSGKHMNWSLNYIDHNGKFRNLFNPQSYNDELFLLFALIKLKAVLSNQQLYLSAVSVPGNQLRLGGHEAPPRIFSAFLGQTVTNMIEKLPEQILINLKDKISHLILDLKQEDTDRNRTSPYAYTSNRFEFRAVGSSQNCYFPMTVILTTIAKEIQEANKKLKSGVSLKELIEQLTKETAAIRFNGDGYSHKWVQQAKQRNLYVNENFTDNISNIRKNGTVLVQTGVFTQRQLDSKGSICQQNYVKIVQIQAKTLLTLLNKNIIPRLYQLLSKLPKMSSLQGIVKRSKKIEVLLDKLIAQSQLLAKKTKTPEMNLLQAQKLRQKIGEIGQTIDESLQYLPQSKDLPEMYDIFRKF